MKRRNDQGKNPPPPETPIRMVVFLGNPGREYRQSRHNVAWMIIPTVTGSENSTWKEKFHGRFLKAGELVCLAPETFMNHSGRSVQAACAFFSIAPAEILIAHDDMETPFETVSLAWAGGHRGNNGVRSVIQALGTAAFWRLRLGVGRPPANRSPGDWILERFSPDEEVRLPGICNAAARLISTSVMNPREQTIDLS